MLKKLEASGELAPMRPWEHATGAAEEQDGAEATAGRVGEPSSSGRKNQTTETKSKSSTKTKAAVAKEERDGSSDDAKGKTKDAGKIMKKKGYNAVLAAAKKAEEIKKQKEAAQLEKEKRVSESSTVHEVLLPGNLRRCVRDPMTRAARR